MTALLWGLSNVLSFLAGVTMFYLITQTEGEAFMHPEGTPPKLHRFRDALVRPFPLASGLVLVFAGAILITIGYQQLAYTESQQRHDACVQRWADQVTSTLTLRVAAAEDVSIAERRRDDAARDLLGVLSRVHSQPPEAMQSDVDEARRAYDVAASLLDAVQQEQVETRDYPYPDLSC